MHVVLLSFIARDSVGISKDRIQVFKLFGWLISILSYPSCSVIGFESDRIHINGMTFTRA